jgi:hypothetical protein
MDVAGATLMVAGRSAPELFRNLFGTFTKSEIGFGTIIGSAVFYMLNLRQETLSLTWCPLFRDSTYYAIGVVVLTNFVGVNTPEEIEVWGLLFSSPRKSICIIRETGYGYAYIPLFKSNRICLRSFRSISTQTIQILVEATALW